MFKRSLAAIFFFSLVLLVALPLRAGWVVQASPAAQKYGFHAQDYYATRAEAEAAIQNSGIPSSNFTLSGSDDVPISNGGTSTYDDQAERRQELEHQEKEATERQKVKDEAAQREREQKADAMRKDLLQNLKGGSSDGLGLKDIDLSKGGSKEGMGLKDISLTHGNDPQVVDARGARDSKLPRQVDEIENSPGNVEAKKGWDAVANHDWKVALAWYQMALKKDPQNQSLRRMVELCDWMVYRLKSAPKDADLFGIPDPADPEPEKGWMARSWDWLQEIGSSWGAKGKYGITDEELAAMTEKYSSSDWTKIEKSMEKSPAYEEWKKASDVGPEDLFGAEADKHMALAYEKDPHHPVLKWWKRNHDHKAELARDPAQAAKKVMTDAKYYDDILFEHLVQESAKSSTNAVKQSSNH